MRVRTGLIPLIESARLICKSSYSYYFCTMTVQEQVNNPLHGKTLEFILKQLVWHYGWEELGQLIRIACFNNNPTMNSSLRFLRKTDWARKKVEKLYLNTFH